MIPVACGALQRADGKVLIARRPAGKIAAGRWEFPGGKIEPGESPAAALGRELEEEIGIQVRHSRPLITLEHAYSDRHVRLHTALVTQWAGEPRACEGQELAWVAPEALPEWDLLSANGPIVTALRLPSQLPFTPDLDDVNLLQTGLIELARQGHTWMRLRAPRLDDAAYAAVVRRAGPALRERGAGLLVDRADRGLLAMPGVLGVHLSLAMAQELGRPSAARWFILSCHSAAELAAAEDIGADALVLGTVRATPSHPAGAVLGLEGFSAAVRGAGCPVFAIGDMGPADLPAVQQRGGQGVAGIRAYWPVCSSEE